MHRTISFFLFFSLVLGTVIVLSSENLFLIWVGLELSTLALIPILCANFTPRNIEAAIKYFLVQALSAALLLNGALINAWLTGSWSILDPLNEVSLILLSIALAFKLGLAPCHFWLPDVLQGLPFLSGLIIATWQKIAPLIILFSLNSIVESKLIIAFSLFSVLAGGWGGLNQTQIRKILAFSSVGNMGWICLTSVYSVNTAFSMFVIYLLINSTIFLVADFLNFFTLGHLNIVAQLSPISVLVLILTILSLGGLPPLTGFMIKFLSLFSLLNNGFIIFSFMLVLGSLLSLFFYLRISFNTSMILFPHHIISLTSWRNAIFVNSQEIKIWTISLLFVFSTITMPLATLLYIFVYNF